jgi:cold shock CspA family protein
MEEIFNKLGEYGFLTNNSDVIDSGKDIFVKLRNIRSICT